jgi:tRNA threonylcarbamoyladenosine biosynthesis protein TsaB
MLVASLDTSTLTLSCALCEVAEGRARLLAERTERAPSKPGPQGPTGGHGGRLPGALQELLVSMGRRLPDIEGYAVGIGPGSFTGLRIGLATWKGLAYANRRPIAACSSLAAMAVAAAPAVEHGALLVPILDAKKGEVYAGFYRAEQGSVRAIGPDAALAPSLFEERLRELRRAGDRPLVFGEGLAALGEVAATVEPFAAGVASPTALGVAVLTAATLEGAPYDAACLFALEPHYIRPSEAELKFPKGHGPGAER